MKIQKERENTMLMVSKDGASDDRATTVYPHALCVHTPKLSDRDRESTYPALLRDVEVGLEQQQQQQQQRAKDCLGDYCTHHYCHQAGTMTPAHNLYHPDARLHQDLIQTLSRLEPCGPGLLDLVSPAEQLESVDVMPLQTFRRSAPGGGGPGEPRETPIKSKDIGPGVREFQIYGRSQPPLRIQPPAAAKRTNPDADAPLTRADDGQSAALNTREQDPNLDNARNVSQSGHLLADRTARK